MGSRSKEYSSAAFGAPIQLAADKFHVSNTLLCRPAVLIKPRPRRQQQAARCRGVPLGLTNADEAASSVHSLLHRIS